MDSRDIKEEPIQVVGGNYLGCIYQLQKELLKGYIGIEGLPQYPIDVNTKKSQVLLKDFTGRVIEELAEGYEAMLQVEELTVKNKFWVDSYDGNDLTQCLNHLQNVGEEMADSLHFMLELLIYANIEPEDIDTFVNTWLEKHAPEVYKKVKGYDTISKAMIMGSTLILHDRVLYQDSGRKYVDLIKVYDGSGYGLVDSDGKQVLPCGYSSISRFSAERAWCISGGDTALCVNSRGEKVFELDSKNIDRFWTFSEEGTIVGRSGLLTYYDRDGNIMIPPKYRYVRNAEGGYYDPSFKNGRAIVHNGSGFGYVDTKGNFTPAPDLK